MTATAPGAPADPDRPLLGVSLMVAFCLIAPLGDATAKLLGALPLAQIMLGRYGMQAALLLPLVRRLDLTPRVWRLTVVRTLLHVGSFTTFVAALRFLPMADAIAIMFVLPFILLLLGRFFLGEEVGPHRLAACAVGFLGTLMVVQPSFAEVGAPALLPLLGALLFAVFMLVTRRIARDADPLVLQAASGLVATAMLVPLLLLGLATGWPDLAPVPLSTRELLLLALLGALGTTAHLVMAWSLRFAPSATLAPIQYLEIPFATLIGYIVFGDLPDGLAAVGIALTVAAGLYVLHRERRAKKRLDRARAAQPPGGKFVDIAGAAPHSPPAPGTDKSVRVRQRRGRG
jgi:drug/metabolite transporter (DMT)-like permease